MIVFLYTYQRRFNYLLHVLIVIILASSSFSAEQQNPDDSTVQTAARLFIVFKALDTLKSLYSIVGQTQVASEMSLRISLAYLSGLPLVATLSGFSQDHIKDMPATMGGGRTPLSLALRLGPHCLLKDVPTFFTPLHKHWELLPAHPQLQWLRDFPHFIEIDVPDLVEILRDYPSDLQPNILQWIVDMGSPLMLYPIDQASSASPRMLSLNRHAINLGNMNFGHHDEIFRRTAHFLAGLKGVWSLSFADNHLEEYGAQLVRYILSQEYKNLVRLDLSGNSFKDRELSLFAGPVRLLPKLTHLTISYNNRVVDGAGWPLNIEGLEALTTMASCPSLTNFTLGGYEYADEIPVEALTRFLRELRLHLKLSSRLHIDFSQSIFPKKFITLLQNKIVASGGRPEQLTSPVDHDRTCLSFTDVDTMQILRLFAQHPRHHSTLLSLNLTECNLFQHQEPLWIALGRLTELKKFIFSDCRLSDISQSDGVERAFSSLIRLEILSLRNNSLSTWPIEGFARALHNLTHLEVIDISQNGLEFREALTIIAALPLSTTVLDLSENRLGDGLSPEDISRYFEALFTQLSRLLALKILDVSGNSLPPLPDAFTTLHLHSTMTIREDRVR